MMKGFPTLTMRALLPLSSLLAFGLAYPVPDPVSIFNRATTPGAVYTKCSTANTLALAYDDGPYQYTQTLVNTLNAAGAKGTFFFTGTLYGKFCVPMCRAKSVADLFLTLVSRLYLQPGRSSKSCLPGRTSSLITYLDSWSCGLHVLVSTDHRDDQG